MAVATQKLIFMMSIAIFFESMGSFLSCSGRSNVGKMPSACSKGKPEQRVIVPPQKDIYQEKTNLLVLAFPKKDSKSHLSLSFAVKALVDC